MMSHIKEKVLAYQKNPQSTQLKKELIAYCQLIIYTYPSSIKLITKEMAAELLLYVNPRLEALLRNFTYTGIPFENYIKKVSYLQAQSFVKLKRNERRRFMCESVSDEDLEYFLYSHPSSSHLEEFQWSEDTSLSKQIKEKIKKSSSFKKRILHLVLLCSDLLNANHISFLAQYLEIDEYELATMISKALEMSEKRIALKEKTVRIRDAHYVEKEFLEREKRFLLSVDAHPYYIAKVEKKVEKEQRYFHQVNQSVRNRCSTVTHATAGKITGVPKGTVDSGLQSLYIYLNNHMDDTTQME